VRIALVVPASGDALLDHSEQSRLASQLVACGCAVDLVREDDVSGPAWDYFLHLGFVDWLDQTRLAAEGLLPRVVAFGMQAYLCEHCERMSLCGGIDHVSLSAWQRGAFDDTCLAVQRAFVPALSIPFIDDFLSTERYVLLDRLPIGIASMLVRYLEVVAGTSSAQRS
jgi:hypothetical protein